MPIDEVCNGLDDDGDNEVDEGFEDRDADGTADCVDAYCSVNAGERAGVSTVRSCAVSVLAAADPWDVELLWEYTDRGVGCRAGAVVDLDDDGISDILCSFDEYVYALSGVDGNRLWRWGGAFTDTPIVIGDLDADGVIDIAAYGADGNIVALDADGTRKWSGPDDVGPAYSTALGSNLEIADLSGDGTPEIIGHHAVVSGADGSKLSDLDPVPDYISSAQRDVAVSDLDDDGVQDILSMWRRYDPNGTLLWSVDWPDEWQFSTSIALLNADADEDAEVAWATEWDLRVVETDGSLLWVAPVPSGYSTVCAGDLDGDGRDELVTIDAYDATAVSIDGSILWERQWYNRGPEIVGCAMFDFDLDGAMELVSSYGGGIIIMGGRTGSFLNLSPFEITSSGWGWGNRPLIADLDGDGSVELIHANSGTPDARHSGPAVQVYSHADRAWPPGMRIWGSPRWSGTQLQSDGRVPRTPHRPWIEYGIWRGQPAAPVTGADLTVEVLHSCLSSCEGGQARLAVRLVNLGPDEVDAGERVSVYAVGTDGNRTLLQVLMLSDWLDDGFASPTWEVVLTSEQARAGVVLRAGDDGTGGRRDGDCDEANDEIAWSVTDCP